MVLLGDYKGPSNSNRKENAVIFNLNYSMSGRRIRYTIMKAENIVPQVINMPTH